MLCILHLFRTNCYTDLVSVAAVGSGIVINEAVRVVDALVAQREGSLTVMSLYGLL